MGSFPLNLNAYAPAYDALMCVRVSKDNGNTEENVT